MLHGATLQACCVTDMIGHPKHVEKALAVGVDLICAQGDMLIRTLVMLGGARITGGEGGGHTGDIPTSILIPKVPSLQHPNHTPTLAFC